MGHRGHDCCVLKKRRLEEQGIKYARTKEKGEKLIKNEVTRLKYAPFWGYASKNGGGNQMFKKFNIYPSIGIGRGYKVPGKRIYSAY